MDMKNTTLASLLMLLGACTSSHGGADADTMVSDAGAEPDAAPSPLCMEVCDSRAGDTGHCELPDCDARCAEIGPTVFDAFTECVEEDPLCFSTLEDCLYDRQYPEPVPTPTTVRGRGLDAYDGLFVHVSLQWDRETLREAQVIVGGAFSIEHAPPMRGSARPRALVFIDVDGDESCTPGTDVTAYVEIERSGTYERPSFEGHLDGESERPADFICPEV